MKRQVLAYLILPYTRLELPAWGRLLNIAGVFKDESWHEAPWCELRGKWHSHLMKLDLSDVQDRITYFSGRYSDLPSQLFIAEAVRAGDVFLDVGANIGMITLVAARAVGPSGQVVAVEPNPDLLPRLRDHIERNNLGQVRIHPIGLSDSEGILTLKIWAKGAGFATFGDLSAEEGRSLEAAHKVTIRRGDDILEISTQSTVAIKIDVEGFECHALRGLERTLATYRPAVITEVEPEHLSRCGSSAKELFELMTGYGHRPYAMDTKRSHLRHRLYLRPIGRPEETTTTNVVWLLSSGAHYDRVRHRIAR